MVNAKEEANKAAEECISLLKKEHGQALVDAKEEGYNEAISEVADECLPKEHHLLVRL